MKKHFFPLLLLLAGCSGATSPALSEAPTSDAIESLAPGDVIEIKVFREKDLDGVYLVSTEGDIELPLIGLVKAAGQTPKLIAKTIETRLANGFLTEPHVTVLVRERNSLKVYVLGKVKKPGTFTYRAGMSVIEAITMAGGFDQLASKNGVRITRKRGKGEEVFKIAAGDIGEGRETNFELLPGDIVFVPEAIF